MLAALEFGQQPNWPREPRKLKNHLKSYKVTTYIHKREIIDVDRAHNKDIGRPVVTRRIAWVSTPLLYKICTFVSL